MLNRAKVAFLLICFFLTAWMSLNQIERFLENRDNSSIRYKRFNESPLDQYPTFSLCFKGPDIYWKNEMLLFDLFGISSQQYVNIMKGNQAWKYVYDDRTRVNRKDFMDISNITGTRFDEFRLSFSNFLQEAQYFSRKQHESKVEEDNIPEKAKFHIGFHIH